MATRFGGSAGLRTGTAILAIAGIMAVLPTGIVGAHGLRSSVTAAGPVICSKYANNYKFPSVTVKQCKPKAGHNYAEATGSEQTLGYASPGQNGTLTWTGGATTTIGPATYTQVENTFNCPLTQGPGFALFDEQTETATIVAASTVGPGIPAVGDPVSATFCYYMKLKRYINEAKAILLPGTAIQL
jgi:hypothetical protein